MVVIIASMPFISGQGSGLLAGIIMIIAYSLIYAVMKAFTTTSDNSRKRRYLTSSYSTEISKELTHPNNKKGKNVK